MPPRHANLIAWQRADELFIEIHRLVKRFPPDERFELSSQIRRAAYSTAANIVEGFARGSPKEKRHFLEFAEGSAAEVGYCLHVAQRLGYIDEREYAELDLRARQVAAPLAGLIRSVK